MNNSTSCVFFRCATHSAKPFLIVCLSWWDIKYMHGGWYVMSSSSHVSWCYCFIWFDCFISTVVLGLHGNHGHFTYKRADECQWDLNIYSHIVNILPDTVNASILTSIKHSFTFHITQQNLKVSLRAQKAIKCNHLIKNTRIYIYAFNDTQEHWQTYKNGK